MFVSPANKIVFAHADGSDPRVVEIVDPPPTIVDSADWPRRLRAQSNLERPEAPVGAGHTPRFGVASPARATSRGAKWPTGSIERSSAARSATVEGMSEENSVQIANPMGQSAFVRSARGEIRARTRGGDARGSDLGERCDP